MKVKQLMELLKGCPDNFEVLIPIDVNYGFACGIQEIRYSSYSQDKDKNYGLYDTLDVEGDCIQLKHADSVVLAPKVELLYEEQKLPYPW